MYGELYGVFGLIRCGSITFPHTYMVSQPPTQCSLKKFSDDIDPTISSTDCILTAKKVNS